MNNPRATTIRKSSFARLLTRARLIRGMTQQEVADRVGVSRCQYTNWETGMFQTQAGRLWSICKALRLDADALLRALERDRRTQDDRGSKPEDQDHE